jgi:hypothetical protein
MLLYGAGSTARVTTGNVRTTYDLYSPPPVYSTGGPTPAAFFGLACPLGTVIIDVGGPDSVSGTTTQLPTAANGAPGQVAVYKYVLYKSTTNPAVLGNPGVVYYTDNTGLVVSGAQGDGYIAQTTAASLSDVAGYMMVNSTDLSTLTATLLNNGTSGSGVWICIGGFVKAARSVGSTVPGDYLYGGGTSFTPQRVAAHSGTLFADRALAVALTAVSSNGSDVNVILTGTAPY